MQKTIKPILLVCWLACGVLPVLAQSAPQIAASSQPAVAALRAVAQAIKECPRAIVGEDEWGKGPLEIGRWYAGPPQNVVWDVVPSSSVRSPYLGYVEFSLSEDYWVPDEVKDKWERSDASTSVHIGQLYARPMHYRYEFDLGPNGLELTRMLQSKDPARIVGVTQPDGTCWQNAARNVQGMSNQSAAIQTAAEVGAVSLINVAGTAFLLQCDADNVIRREACKVWLDGFYNGLAAAGVMVVAIPKDAGKNNVVCFPQTPKEEQLFDLILKYIKDHPRDEGQPTAALALRALQDVFPCKQAVN